MVPGNSLISVFCFFLYFSSGATIDKECGDDTQECKKDNRIAPEEITIIAIDTLKNNDQHQKGDSSYR